MRDTHERTRARGITRGVTRCTGWRLVRHVAGIAAAATLTAGCGDQARLVAPADVPDAHRSSPQVAAGIDVGGSWVWREGVVSIMPREIAPFLGIEPEGTVTHVRCTNHGTLTLAQDGSTVTGAATQTSACRTRGGQQFSPFPPVLTVTDGRIAGRSLHFSFGGCPYHAVARLVDGVAVELTGGGTCPVDVHPALLNTVSWTAVRS